MRIAPTLAGILVGCLLSTAALSDAKTESNQSLTTIARWGMCLVDTMGETQAKGVVYAAVAKLDETFRRKHGRAATEIAQETYGENFVQVYYDRAKADHARLGGNRATVCQNLNQRVVALAK